MQLYVYVNFSLWKVIKIENNSKYIYNYVSLIQLVTLRR